MARIARRARGPLTAASLLALAALVGSTLAGANDSCPTPTPTATTTSTASPTPTATTTSTASPTPTPTGTPTPTPTDTPTPTPTDTPSATETPTPTDSPTPPTIWETIFSLIPSALPSSLPSLPTPQPTETATETPAAGAQPAQQTTSTPAPDPCREGTLTISVNPTVAVTGSTFRIAGSLTCAGSAVPDAIVIVAKISGNPSDFQPSQARTTNAEGRYSVLDHPNAAAEYVASWSGNDACGRGARSSTARAYVRPGILLNQSSTVVPLGREVELTGSVMPGHPNGFVVLQVLRGDTGRWWDVAWVRLGANSAYRFAYRRTGERGYLVFRVGFPTQDGDHVWNISRRVRVDWN